MNTPNLVDVDDVRGGVDTALDQHLTQLADELASYGSPARALVESLRTTLESGKRMRAAVCYWSWVAHGGQDLPTAAPRDSVLGVGAALELFQAAALVHDDVMDASDLRRGRPSAHRAFEADHRAAGWLGEPGRFGESAAILLGDLALIASERQVHGALRDVAAEPAERTREVFDRMRTEVTVGQFLDVRAESLPLSDSDPGAEERARHVIRAKSARYSVEHPLTLGAHLAGADDAAVARCAAIGLPLGEAFQLRDDVLGVFGDPRVTGKPAGDDLREGKRTVLVAHAFAQAGPRDRALLTANLGRRDLSVEDAHELCEVLRRTGAVVHVESLIAELGNEALAAIDDAELTAAGRTMLVRLAQALLERTA